MNIGLSTFEEKLSVAFDFAENIFVFSIDNNNKIIDKKQYNLSSANFFERANEIKKLEVDILICGCISRCSLEMLNQMGIKVISHVSGTIDSVINAYLKNELNNPKFSLPGFGKGKGRRRRCRRKNFIEN